MTVTPLPLITSGSVPGPNDIWTPEIFLRPDWNGPQNLTRAYSTEITANRNAGEQRRARQGRPTMSVQSAFISDRPYSAFTSFMRRGIAGTLFPLPPEMFSYSQGAGSVITTTKAATRRLSVGQYVIIYDSKTDTMTIRQVSIMTSSNVTMSGSVPSSGVVYPCIQARINESSSYAMLSDTVASGQLNAVESVGYWNTDPLVPGGNISAASGAGIPLAQALPIFDLPINYASTVGLTFAGQGSFAASGIGEVAEFFGDRPRVQYSVTVRALDRTVARRMIALFDYAMGRCFAFWFAPPAKLFSAVQTDVDEVTLAYDGSASAMTLAYYGHIFLRTKDTIEVLEIDSIASSPGSIVVTTTEEFDLDNIVRAGPIAKCRFSSDELSESWFTNEACDFQIGVTELLEEKTVTIQDGVGEYVEQITESLSGVWDPFSLE